MNLVQVPVALMLLSAGAAQRALPGAGAAQAPASLWSHVVGALREPVVWAPLLALLLVAFNLRFPPVIEESLGLLGKATGGVALFASGIVLYSRKVQLNLPVTVSVLARNLVIPGLVWGGMLALGMNAQVTREAVLTLAIPTASICVILAVQYQAAEQEMASTLFFSTILSVVTMGGFIWLTA